MKIIEQIIAENIESARKEASLNEEAFGLKMKWKKDNAQSRVNQYERYGKRGFRSPSKKMLRKMAEMLNKPETYFYIDYQKKENKQYFLNEDALMLAEEIQQYGAEAVQKCREVCREVCRIFFESKVTVPVKNKEERRKNNDKKNIY